jgi:hypothetical protein
MCSPAHTVTLPLPEYVCNQQIMVIYNLYYYMEYLLLFNYHVASCLLKKGSLSCARRHLGFIQLLSILHLQPKLPDRFVRPCLVDFKNKKLFKIFRHVKSCNTCIKH